MAMSVQELINVLQKVKEKNKTICIESLSDHLDEYEFELSTEHHDQEHISIIMNNHADET